MAVSDPFVKDWIDANMHWLHWVAPAAGAAFVVGLGKHLAKRAEAAHGVVDLAKGDQQN